jgi:hypothetical protein
MRDDVSRLLGIEGMAVTGVADHGWSPGLEVEMLTCAGCRRWCGRSSLKVKERDRARVRDLPVAGRMSICVGASGGFGAKRVRGRLPRPPGAAVA